MCNEAGALDTAGSNWPISLALDAWDYTWQGKSDVTGEEPALPTLHSP